MCSLVKSEAHEEREEEAEINTSKRRSSHGVEESYGAIRVCKIHCCKRRGGSKPELWIDR